MSRVQHPRSAAFFAAFHVLRAPVLYAALVVGCATPRPVVSLDAPGDVAIVDVSVVDGTGAPALLHQDVVVKDGRIASIAPTGTTALPARTLDGRNKTVLPGYVDAHAHVSGTGVPAAAGRGMTVDENLQRWLAAGVTTVFDMSGAGPEMTALAERLDDGTLPGPQLFHTHLVITGKGAHPIPISRALVPGGALAGLVLPQVEDDNDVERVLDEADEQVPDYVKIAIDRMPAGTPQLDRALMEKLVRGAKKRGHLVFVHAGDVDDAVAAAEAGATALAHLPWRGVLTPEKAQRLKQSGVVVVTTVAMWDTLPRAIAGEFTASAADRDLIPKEVIATAEQKPQKDPDIVAVGQELGDNTKNREESFQALLAAGVPLLVGTDASIPAVWPGSGYVAELQALLAHGLPVNDLIVAMTSRPARVVGGKNVDFGVVATGKRADLVVVDGDPLADPTALWRIAHVVRGGRVVERLPRTP